MSMQALRWVYSDAIPTSVTGAQLATLAYYANIANNEGRCWPSQETVAAALHISPRALSRHLNALEGHGLIRRQRRNAPKGRGRHSDMITLMINQTNCQIDTGTNPTNRHEQPDTMSGSYNNNIYNRNPTIESSKNPHSPPRPADTATIENFVGQFLAAYPRRDVPHARWKVHQEFEVAINNGTHPDAIIAGARAYAEAMRSAKNIGTRFVKNAVAWLQERQWQDYAENAKKLNRVFVKSRSKQFDAWYIHFLLSYNHAEARKMQFVADKGTGRHVPTQWPPNYNADSQVQCEWNKRNQSSPSTRAWIDFFESNQASYLCEQAYWGYLYVPSSWPPTLKHEEKAA